MDIFNNPQLPETCIKHNQPIILVDPDPKKGTFCSICIQNMTGLVSIYQLKQQQQELIDKSNKENNFDKQQLQNALEIMLNFQKSINQSLDKIIQVIKDQIEGITSYKKQISMVIQSETISSLTIEALNAICESKQKNNTQVRNQIEQQLQKLVIEHGAFEKLINLFDNQKQERKIESLKQNQKFQYELLEESSINESEYCRAFAFNKQGNILVVACGKRIIVNDFTYDQIDKELQKLTNHTAQVLCLYFMQRDNLFISGSCDQQIIIWELNDNNFWSPKSYLKEHKGDVVCILMNKSEDLIISGSKDHTVKFWVKISNQWNCTQTIDTKYYVYSISLNEQENKLVSCGWQSPIKVMYLQSDRMWSIVQTIQVCEWGWRLTFIKNNQFIFQPLIKDFIELYGFEEKQNQFTKLKEIKIQKCSACDYLFPCQFLQQLNVLTVKHGEFLNIFRYHVEGDYELIQTIKFGQMTLFGILKDNGEYLVTWDTQSKQIQIRQLKYLD